MTSKERIIAAIRKEKVDRIPVCPEIEARFANHLVGRCDWKGVYECHQIIGSDAFQFQGVGPEFYLRWDPGWSDETRIIGYPGGRVVRERRIQTPRGSLKTKIVSNYLSADPVVNKIIEYPIKRLQDYELYLNYLEQWLKMAVVDNSEVREAIEVVKDNGVVSFWITDAFYSVGQMRGMSRYLLDFYDAPELMRTVFDTVQKVKDFEIQAFNNSPSEVLIYDCCWASTSIVSPIFFKDWVLPGLKRVVKNINKNKYLGVFLSGKIKDLMPLIMEAKPHFVTPFDNVNGDFSLKNAKKEYGEQICIMGNFNPLILVRGNRTEAEKETNRCLEEGAKGGGYILGTSDEVPADAQLENLKIMVEIAEHYGKFS